MVERRDDVDGAEPRQVVADVALHPEVDGDDAAGGGCDAVERRRSSRRSGVVTVLTRSTPSVPGSRRAAAEEVGFRARSERAGDGAGVTDDAG